MSKKVILADGSYTIRRIVELSFEGEDDYELITIDNGAELKEKLEVIKPHVVVVDVNLPDINGYDICEYINTNDNLNNIKVILLKGSFEPIDENRLGKLQYEEIIQKPFESNQFIETVKRIANKFTIPEPPSLPEEDISNEDISNIDFNDSEDISFSDVKEELEKEEVNIDVNPDEFTEDNNDVMPSEEITQGSLSEHEDKLIEEQVDEVSSNPFSEEKVVEEDDINQNNFNTVYKEDSEVAVNNENEVGLKDDSENIVNQEVVNDNLTLDTNIEDNLVEREEQKEDISEEIVKDEVETHTEKIEDNTSGDVSYNIGNAEDLSNEDTKQEIGKKDLLMDTQDEDDLKGIDFGSGEKVDVSESNEFVEEKEKSEDIENVEINEEKEMIDSEESKEGTAEIETNIGSNLVEEDFSSSINELDNKEEDIKQSEEFYEKKEIISEEISEDKIDETFGVEKQEEIVTDINKQVEQEVSKFGDEISKEEILNRIEGKLVDVVKEILWEVLPPIAEKIIKEEIERIREELSKLQ